MLAVMLFYSLTCVVKYAPVEHKNKPLMQTVRRKNRIQAIILDLAVTIMIIVFWRIERNLAGVFLINKLEVIISMLIGNEVYRMSTCPRCGGKVVDNRCTECLYIIPDNYKETPKKVFLTMPNLKEISTVVNRQYSVEDFADSKGVIKKSGGEIAKLIGRRIVQGIMMVGSIALLGTLLTLLGNFLSQFV